MQWASFVSTRKSNMRKRSGITKVLRSKRKPPQRPQRQGIVKPVAPGEANFFLSLSREGPCLLCRRILANTMQA